MVSNARISLLKYPVIHALPRGSQVMALQEAKLVKEADLAHSTLPFASYFAIKVFQSPAFRLVRVSDPKFSERLRNVPPIKTLPEESVATP